MALYRSASGVVQVECLLRDETLWLTQKALAELFGGQRPAVTKHLRNIFSTGELAEEAVCSILENTSADGKCYTTKYYNLDAVIAVGYRVNSYQATQFRIWATRVLKEFMIKGFALDDERLKQGERLFGKAYLDLAENRAQRGILMKMRDWVDFLHSFLELSDYPILKDKGKVAILEAKLKAEQAYEVFRQRQDAEYISDFDREVRRLKGERTPWGQTGIRD